MLSRIFKIGPSRIFLGTLAVAPRVGFKSSIEQWTVFNGRTEDLDEKLKSSLEEIFAFPSANDVVEPRTSDLVIDVMVPDFQSGEFTLDEFIGMPIAAMWRPKVKVASRIYYLKSNKTKKTFVVTQKMSFREYLARGISWRGFFRLRPLFDSKDMDYLVSLACYKLLKQVKQCL